MTSPSAHRGRGGITLTALAVLALVIGVAVVGFAVTQQRPDPPSPTLSAQQESESATSAPRAAEEDEAPQPEAAEDGEATREAAETTEEAATEVEVTEEAPQGMAPSEPVEVRIPSIAVTSPLHPLGLNPDGTLEVPTGDRVDEAAWYDGSPTPGEIGPMVIEGHVTGPGGRPSIFFELGALAPGDTAEVDRADGQTVTYEVYRVDQFAKDAFPTVDVYGPTTESELRLITCGGEFDDATGHHVDNTVVYARMITD